MKDAFVIGGSILLAVGAGFFLLNYNNFNGLVYDWYLPDTQESHYGENVAQVEVDPRDSGNLLYHLRQGLSFSLPEAYIVGNVGYPDTTMGEKYIFEATTGKTAGSIFVMLNMIEDYELADEYGRPLVDEPFSKEFAEAHARIFNATAEHELETYSVRKIGSKYFVFTEALMNSPDFPGGLARFYGYSFYYNGSMYSFIFMVFDRDTDGRARMEMERILDSLSLYRI